MDDRETNPPPGFKSMASIFHAPAGIQIHAGNPPILPHPTLAFPSLSRSDDKSRGRPGKRNNHRLCLPTEADDATYIGRLEYSNVLRVVDQILTFTSYLI